ncbi:TORTIFOLIA1-like protein 4 isoform X2 [Vitis vinifera]|uniref:TORTIFOLIA1-like protein 4 isoform X2 n=1 Tax=Vitis vinifera TaxID=29760 RepID=UPI0008FEC3AE|nr:TORTIFOLIA1-like protein 4 isoform X2 [Vitis vinifera]|eukprot:XP_019076160.1 PREDICTED: microtubule-associated protein TORTIFOLIA1 isoform X2 [Vitis vinifera]
MSLSKKTVSTRDLKHRVITCLNKLSDRDTLAVGTAELESIARNLTHDSFSPFLSCLYGTDSSEKSPVRKQCVRLLGVLSETHGDSLSPHLSKMLSNVVRRLRDSDSAVRLACVDAVGVMSSQITKPPFSAFLKPLTDSILLEQDYNLQIGSALCIAAAIEAAPDPEPEQLLKLLPRLLKLAKSESFRAKPALLSLIGSIIGAGGASTRGVLNSLVPCLVEFLSSEDWAARKASAEALARLALVERDLATEFKSSSLSSLESRRFDKVKVVRDTMNRTLDLWKELPCDSNGLLPLSPSKASSKDNGAGGCFPPASKISCDVGFETPQPKKIIPTRSPPSDNSLVTTARKRSPLQSSNNGKSTTAMFRKLDCKKPSDWKVEVAVPHPSSSKVACEDDLKRRYLVVSDSEENGNCGDSRPETNRVLFSKISNEKMHKFGCLRSGSRIVPFHENNNSESAVVDSNATEEEIYENQKDIEDLSLIRKQLIQIENQQSSMLNLLQVYWQLPKWDKLSGDPCKWPGDGTGGNII